MHAQNTSDWYDISFDGTFFSYVDWSSLLDAPAGKHGFVKGVGAELYFEDHSEARFLGVNLVGANCFPAKENADKMVQQLAQMGCNLVRLHHLDAAWANPNIFGNTSGTRSIHAGSMDKLDYLISQLKQKGIYVFIDLLVHRTFTTNDSVVHSCEPGGKQAAFFDPLLIDLQKEYAAQIFSHVNRYTNLAYKDEPAIIGTCIINEASIIALYDGDCLTPHYKKQLQQLFVQKFPDKKLAFFDIDYRYTEGGLKVKEDGDVFESLIFYTETETTYFSNMKSYLRSIGVKCLISGSNYPRPVLNNMHSNKDNDLIIANNYWDHPKVHLIANDWSRVAEGPIDNLSQLKQAGKNMIVNLARFRNIDKPFIVTEWSQPYPNTYRLESFPFIACYGLMQGWQGLCQFDYQPSPLGIANLTSFNIGSMPDMMAQWSIMAPLFHKKYIQQAHSCISEKISEEMLYRLPAYSDFNERYSFFNFITKTGKTFDETVESNHAEFLSYLNTSTGEITSEGRDLIFAPRQNHFRIQADKVQGLVGKLPAGVTAFPFFSLETEKPDFVCIIALSEDGKALAESDSILVCLISEVIMTDQQFDFDRKRLQTQGRLPEKAHKSNTVITINTGFSYVVYKLPEQIASKTLDGSKDVLNISDGKTFMVRLKRK